MLLAGLWIIAIWYASSRNGSFVYDRNYDIFLWLLFVFETSLLTLLVRDRKRYLSGNWLNLVIIALGIPLLWGFNSYFGALRLLRLLILFSLLLHVGGTVLKMLSSQSFVATLIGSAIVTIMAGVMIAVIDPNIQSPAEGIWWAWVTITTVGYGDVVPSSGIGRAFGSLLILIGIGLFSLLTATLSALLISKQEEQIFISEKNEADQIQQLKSQLQRVEIKLDQLLNERKKEL